MTDLEKMQQWLQSYPGWEENLAVNFVEAEPGNTGLFPTGPEEVSRQQDVLGNLKITCRYRFTLYRRTAGRTDSAYNAQWLLDFQHWVQQQSAAGLAPCFGDVPEQERIYAKGGALQKASLTGVYAVTLVADFMKVYEVA